MMNSKHITKITLIGFVAILNVGLLAAYLVPPQPENIIEVPNDYPTIQEAIDAAEPGDTILVAAGTYTENIEMKSMVHILGTGGSLITPSDPADDAIIDGGEAGRTVYFGYNVDQSSLTGFTIKNGRGVAAGGNIYVDGKGTLLSDNLIIDGRTLGGGGYGGGIYLSTRADYSRVLDNVIQDNWAWASGGGIESRADGVLIEGNTIYNNQSDWAGGLYIYGSHNIIRQNIIDDNYADFRNGGGIYITDIANDTLIENNTIVNNSAISWGYGGAMYIREVEKITIRNNIIAYNRNSSAQTGGIHFVLCPPILDLTYNLVFENQGADYNACEPGTGSFSDDPLFIDTENRDYHLQLISPAIDRGNPDPYFNDPGDPNNPGFALYPALGTLRNDLGAYGGRTEPFAYYLPVVLK